MLFGGGELNHGARPDTWIYGAYTPADAQPIGAGCAGSAGVPVLTSDRPRLGRERFALELRSARPLSACVFAWSTNPQSLAVGGGCTLYLAEPMIPVPAISNGAGFANAHISIPPVAAWRGLTLYAQAVVADPQGPVFGLAFSAGRRLVLGD